MVPSGGPSLNRRDAISLLVASFAAGIVSSRAVAVEHASGTRSRVLHIATQGPELGAASLDLRSGALTPLTIGAGQTRGNWLLPHPTLPILYATDEIGVGAEARGTIVAFRRTAGGSLERLGAVETGGAGATHLLLDNVSRTIFVANYGGGSTSTIALDPLGVPTSLVSTIRAIGKGPNTRRQQSPHAHGLAMTPDGRHVLVADLGADRVWIYHFDRRTRMITLTGNDFIAKPGSGPRHLALHSRNGLFYLINELTADMQVLRWDARAEALVTIQTLSTNAAGFAGTSSAAEVGISRDGRFLYVSNRGDSTIVTYSIHRRSGLLAPVQRVPSGGETPWTFAISPDGGWMLVANQRSGRIAVFKVDQRTGKLTETPHGISISKSVSIAFTL